MALISLEQFINTIVGKSIDFDCAYGYQCVDLFNFYNADVIGAPFISTNATGGARDIWEAPNVVRDEFYQALAPAVPFEPRDVLVYGPPHGRAIVNGQQVFYGHVAVYIGNGQVINQNGRRGEVVSIDPVFKNGLLGILRPRSSAAPVVAPDVPEQPQNKNTHTIKSGDTFWGLEESNGWEHGALQALNPGMVATELKIGDQMIIPKAGEEAAPNNETYYTIVRGDNFWKLEDAWGLPHGRLIELNPGVEPKRLQIGQSIRRS
jgi:LysM repeat protein